MTAFSDNAPCSLVEVDRRSRGAYCLYHHGTSQTSVHLPRDYEAQYPTRLSSSYSRQTPLLSATCKKATPQHHTTWAPPVWFQLCYRSVRGQWRNNYHELSCITTEWPLLHQHSKPSLKLVPLLRWYYFHIKAQPNVMQLIIKSFFWRDRSTRWFLGSGRRGKYLWVSVNLRTDFPSAVVFTFDHRKINASY
jgi:hypothetical protein